MKFKAKVIPSGNATAVEIPSALVEGLGAGARPPVTITINGHSWRSRVAVMGGKSLLGISAANRGASQIAEGQLVEVHVALDSEPRTIAEPEYVTAALNKRKELREVFDRLPFGLRRKHIANIEEAKSEETRQRRLEKLLSELAQGAA